MASWLLHSSQDQVVQVRALAMDIALCSGARHFTLTVPPSNPVYKWLPANLMLGVTLQWTSILSRRELEILLVASCYRNRDELQPGRPLDLYLKDVNEQPLNGSIENEDPENGDPKTEDLRKRRPPTKTETPLRKRRPPAKTSIFFLSGITIVDLEINIIKDS